MSNVDLLYTWTNLQQTLGLTSDSTFLSSHCSHLEYKCLMVVRPFQLPFVLAASLALHEQDV